jgi:uncharacterized membrane protein
MMGWVVTASEYAIVFIDAIALVVVIIAVVEAFVSGLRVMFRHANGHERRDVWLRFARWLVAALTFQLAADIVETSITQDWMSIGRIAAIAAIRTALNYFLERDLDKTRAEQRTAEAPT